MLHIDGSGLRSGVLSVGSLLLFCERFCCTEREIVMDKVNSVLMDVLTG